MGTFHCILRDSLHFVDTIPIWYLFGLFIFLLILSFTYLFELNLFGLPHVSFVKVCLTVSVYATEISINHARLTSATAMSVVSLNLLYYFRY